MFLNLLSTVTLWCFFRFLCLPACLLSVSTRPTQTSAPSWWIINRRCLACQTTWSMPVTILNCRRSSALLPKKVSIFQNPSILIHLLVFVHHSSFFFQCEASKNRKINPQITRLKLFVTTCYTFAEKHYISHNKKKCFPSPDSFVLFFLNLFV